MSGGSRVRQPNKASLTMRNELERRGIDIVEMQLEVYRKAMAAFDSRRGCTDGSEGDENGPGQSAKDTGASYLAVANQAVGTLARYSYPTMSAIAVQELEREVAVPMTTSEAINVIKNDPFAARVAQKATSNSETGLPVLMAGKKEE